nr:hypothetical protein [Anaerolineae bacterium]
MSEVCGAGFLACSSGMESLPHFRTGNEAESLFRRPWDELQAAAWEVRERHHPPDLVFAVPGAKRYETEHYRNTPYRFASISLTGRYCALGCEHCR